MIQAAARAGRMKRRIKMKREEYEEKQEQV
jgi:hypothetical protein